MLTHGYDRYNPYKLIVKASTNPGFVFVHGQTQIDILNKLLLDSGTPYQHISFENYEIYQPAHPIPSLVPDMINPPATTSIRAG